MALLAGAASFIVLAGWLASATAQPAAPPREGEPPRSESEAPGERARPRPKLPPHRGEDGRGNPSTGSEAEIQDAPDEPAPRGCPILDRKLELIV